VSVDHHSCDLHTLWGMNQSIVYSVENTNHDHFRITFHEAIVCKLGNTVEQRSFFGVFSLETILHDFYHFEEEWCVLFFNRMYKKI